MSRGRMSALTPCRSIACSLFALFAAVPVPGCAQAPPPAATGARVQATYAFPDLPLGKALADVLHVKVATDRGLLLTAGSDLWRGDDDAADEFWMLSDRGPNGLVTVDKVPHRTFLVPEFSPVIVHVKAAAARLAVLGTTAIVGSSGHAVTGISNIDGHDEVPYDATGAQRIGYDPNGLDTEGLVRLRDGTFWVAEEYGPSLAHVDRDGKVLLRLLPQ